ncbi:MAG: glycosyltransferase family 2 protein [Promethearchaeota archaeon]
MTIVQKIINFKPANLQGNVDPQKSQVVILIPTYNEENDIATLVTKTKGTLNSFLKNFNIIVIDDGSKDRTREILDIMEVERFYHRKNLGKGDVIRNVLEFLSDDEIVVTMDGDGEHDPADIARLVKPILNGDAEMVIGSRFINNKNTESNYLKRDKDVKFFKNFGNRLFTFLLWIFTRKRITDTQSGFRAFRSGVMQSLNLSSDGFRIEMEITVKSIKKGYRIMEVPIKNCQSNRNSHLNPLVDGARITLTIFREVLPRAVRRFFDWLLPRIPNKLGRLIA